VAFTPDGKTALTGHPDHLATWDVQSGALLRVWQNDSPDASQVALTPDGKAMFTSDGLGILWDAQSGTRLRLVCPPLFADVWSWLGLGLCLSSVVIAAVFLSRLFRRPLTEP
jgi:WD40 repeat protein